MCAAELPKLPIGWQYNENALGGVDLRVAVPRQFRTYFGAAVAVLTALAGWRTLVNWPMGLKGSAPAWLGITLLLGFIAIWCALADERWHIERNYLEHRINIGRFAYSSHYLDAELEIALRFVNRRPAYRLYVIVNRSSHFLIERDEEALHQLASFISFHTGWPIRPLRLPPFAASAILGVEEIEAPDWRGKYAKDIPEG